jgi:nicotinamide-nucleotide amidase
LAVVTQANLELLAGEVGALLKSKGWTLATAESCTGDWIAQAMTALAGSSAWFECGFVTYSNAAKMRMLGVAEITLVTHGAVSEATVQAMARGALQNSGAQVSVAVSGIAGPGGDSPEKPVGTVWIAWACPACVRTQRFVFSGDRAAVRGQTVAQALEGLKICLVP